MKKGINIIPFGLKTGTHRKSKVKPNHKGRKDILTYNSVYLLLAGVLNLHLGQEEGHDQVEHVHHIRVLFK